jgi:hypothetical protein
MSVPHSVCVSLDSDTGDVAASGGRKAKYHFAGWHGNEPSCNLYPGIDFVGNDLPDMPTVDTSIEACAAACVAAVECTCFSFSSAMGCHLKSSDAGDPSATFVANGEGGDVAAAVEDPYEGCFVNQNPNRVGGHTEDLSFDDCKTLASEAGKPYVTAWRLGYCLHCVMKTSEAVVNRAHTES